MQENFYLGGGPRTIGLLTPPPQASSSRLLLTPPPQASSSRLLLTPARGRRWAARRSPTGSTAPPATHKGRPCCGGGTQTCEREARRERGGGAERERERETCRRSSSCGEEVRLVAADTNKSDFHFHFLGCGMVSWGRVRDHLTHLYNKAFRARASNPG